jgi:hypothetical protein
MAQVGALFAAAVVDPFGARKGDPLAVTLAMPEAAAKGDFPARDSEVDAAEQGILLSMRFKLLAMTSAGSVIVIDRSFPSKKYRPRVAFTERSR